MPWSNLGRPTFKSALWASFHHLRPDLFFILIELFKASRPRIPPLLGLYHREAISCLPFSLPLASHLFPYLALNFQTAVHRLVYRSEIPVWLNFLDDLTNLRLPTFRICQLGDRWSQVPGLLESPTTLFFCCSAHVDWIVHQTGPIIVTLKFCQAEVWLS